MALKNFITCVYEDDDGINYLKRMDARYQGQDDGGSPPVPRLGAIAATSTQRRTLGNPPHDLKPRTVIIQTADGAFHTRVPVFSRAAYVALDNGTALNFWDGQGTLHAGVVVGHEGERKSHKLDVA